MVVFGWEWSAGLLLSRTVAVPDEITLLLLTFAGAVRTLPPDETETGDGVPVFADGAIAITFCPSGVVKMTVCCGVCGPPDCRCCCGCCC